MQQRIQPERKPGTAPLGQQQLEQSLGTALNAGVQAIVEQIHYILAYSQMLALPSVAVPYSSKPLRVPHARLTAVLAYTPNLKPEQAQRLYSSQITEHGHRLLFQAQLLPHLPEDQQLNAALEVWEQQDSLDDNIIRARILFHLVNLPVLANLPATSGTYQLPIVQTITKIASAESRVRSMIALAGGLPPDTAEALYQRILEDVDLTPIDSLRSSTIVSIAPQVSENLYPYLLVIADKIRSPMDRARAFGALAQAIPHRMDLYLEALDAVAAISGEEECAEALIAFAPSLEGADNEIGYPETLQKALHITVGFSRRHIRARALVALAPHFTRDLQGEALAAVHSLTNERDRATLLAELAPRLPPDMLVASLAVAHTMREQDSRVHALNILAHYVPEQARAQTVLDALAAASNLPNHLERVSALTSLFDILPEPLVDQAYANALETTRLIENENARARALSLLSHHLPPRLLERALDAAYHLGDLQQRLNTLTSIAARFPDDQRQKALKMMLECARQMPFEYRRARALVTIAPHLTLDQLNDVLEIAATLHDPFDKVSAYIAIAQNLPRDQRPQLIADAWKLLRKIEDGYDRASALVAIAPFLPSPARPDLIKMAHNVVDAIGDEYDKASAISILVPLLTDPEQLPAAQPNLPAPLTVLSRGLKAVFDTADQTIRAQLLGEYTQLWLKLPDEEDRYLLWRETAHRLKSLPLADVLLCLSVMVPVIRAMGGEDSTARIAQLLSVQREKQPGRRGDVEK